jgi:hypothetical protein
VLVDTAQSTKINADLKNELSGPNISVFASETGNEVGFEKEEWHHSAFAKALLDALTGTGHPPFASHTRPTGSFCQILKTR